MGADAGYWEDNWARVHLIVPAGCQLMAYSLMPAPKYSWLVGGKKKNGTIRQNVVYLRISTSASKGAWRNDPTSKCHLFIRPALLTATSACWSSENDSSFAITAPLPGSHQNFENVALRVPRSQMQNAVYDLLHWNSFESNNNDEKTSPS